MTAPSTRRSVVFAAPRHVTVVAEDLDSPGAGEMIVQTIVSAISPGTELLVYRDEIPSEMPLDASIPDLARDPGFPLKYGYAAVGEVIELGTGVSGDWLGSLVFCLHPHESHFLATAGELELVPDGVSPEDAALFASMETAVTLVMDGRPMVGEDVGVFGQGVVGLLSTALLARFPLARLVTFDLHPLRRRRSRELGADEVVDAAAGPAHHGAFDLTYELSGSPAVLDRAIASTRFHGRVVIGSWYGERRAPLDLGGGFHRSRIALLSSQVSTIDPALSGRWTGARRRQATWRLLSTLRPSRLVTHRFPLSAAAAAYELLDQHPDEAVAVLLTYGS